MKNIKLYLTLPGIHFLIINLIALISCYYLVIAKQEPVLNLLETTSYFSTLFLPSIVSLYKIKTFEKECSSVSHNLLGNITIKYSYVKIFVYVNFLLMVFLLLNIRLDLVMSNTQYLTMVNVKQMGLTNPILIVYQKSISFIGAISFFIMMLISTSKKFDRKLLMFLLFLVGGTCYVYQMGNNSRSVGLILGGYLLGVFLLHKDGRVKYVKIVATLIILVYSYTSVLVGRGGTYQGVAHIYENVEKTHLDMLVKDGFLFENLFAGAYIHYLGRDESVIYPETYKILSFSILPSNLDGFDKYRKYTGFVNPFVPFNNILELSNFGIPYLVFYLLILSVALFYINRVVVINSIIGYILAMPSYLFFIANQQYPIRNFFRYLLVSGLVSAIYYYYNQNKRK